MVYQMAIERAKELQEVTRSGQSQAVRGDCCTQISGRTYLEIRDKAG